MPIPFDYKKPDSEAVRQIFFDWLRGQISNVPQLCHSGQSYDSFVEYVGPTARQELADAVQHLFWELVLEGVVAPGRGAGGNLQCLPWFHITEYGRTVVEQSAGHPHDPTAYMKRLRSRIPSPDATVLAYVGESLSTFRRGAIIAAAVMLGVAAERVFLLVCESVRDALADPQEKNTFTELLKRFAMKPKLDWVHEKLLRVASKKHQGVPENATLAVTAIYDLLRTQRNDLGHPRELPPVTDREEVLAHLQIFPRFYETAERLRVYLATSQI